jgi:hypothetical protein
MERAVNHRAMVTDPERRGAYMEISSNLLAERHNANAH